MLKKVRELKLKIENKINDKFFNQINRTANSGFKKLGF